MVDDTLQSLYDAVQKLSSDESLALLNLDESVLDDPATPAAQPAKMELQHA